MNAHELNKRLHGIYALDSTVAYVPHSLKRTTHTFTVTTHPCDADIGN